MQGKCGMAPSDIRSILEGYCLESEFVTTVSLHTEENAGVWAYSFVPSPTVKIRNFAKIESEALPPDTRIVQADPLILDKEPVKAGDFPANVIQYKEISDEWLLNCRDCQVIPVVKRMTGLSFDGPKRVTEYHSGTGSTILILNQRPIRQIHAINLITNPDNWVYVSPSSVEPLQEEGILKLKAVLESWQNYVPAFPRGTDNIKVDYEYGYDDVPCEVKYAVSMLVASFALGTIGNRDGGTGISVQGFSKSYGQRGKYTAVRDELERWADSILRSYVMGMVGT
jgi:hypothetical protein